VRTLTRGLPGDPQDLVVLARRRAGRRDLQRALLAQPVGGRADRRPNDRGELLAARGLVEQPVGARGEDRALLPDDLQQRVGQRLAPRGARVGAGRVAQPP
jgi:hypothetical protein